MAPEPDRLALEATITGEVHPAIGHSLHARPVRP